MTQVPVVKPKKVVKALERAGFIFVRQRGSHIHFRHPDRPGIVTVPKNKKDLHPKTLKTIVEKQAKMTMEEFVQLLKN